MNLDPEMRTLLKQLADNTGRLARAVEAVLDAERLEELAEKWNAAPAHLSAGGGRMDLPPCECEICVRRREIEAERAKNT